MSISVCGQTGGNTGFVRCAESPDVPQNWAIWGGSLTPTQLLTAAAIKAALLADSKLSKSAAAKLFLMPAIIDRTKNKEANTEQTFTSGLKVITREGLPGWRFGFLTNQAQMKQLRKFNGFVLPVVFQDKKKNTWGTVDGSGNFVGRQASIYFEGLSGGTDSEKAGVGYVEIGFIDAVEAYDDQYFVKTDFSWQAVLKGLLDVQLTQKATATSVSAVSQTIATGSITITGIGSNADTFHPKLTGGTDLTVSPVAKTGSETTAALLATKIAAQITTDTATNGGFTAAAVGAVITVSVPAGFTAAAANALTWNNAIVGGITATDVDFSGGVDAITAGRILHISLTVDVAEAGLPEDIYSQFSSSALGTAVGNYVVTGPTGAVVTPESVAPNAAGYFDLKLATVTTGAYTIDLAAPNILDGANIVGIEGIPVVYTLA